MEIGVKGNKELVVTEALLANQVGSGLVAVYATPMMVAGMEGTAAESVQALLEPGKTTVGMHLDVSHESATPLGMKVRFETELVDIASNGKILTFRVAAFDEAGPIGHGTHKRAVVDRARFEQKAGGKLEK